MIELQELSETVYKLKNNDMAMIVSSLERFALAEDVKELSGTVYKLEHVEIPDIKLAFDKYVLIEELERIRAELAPNAPQPVRYYKYSISFIKK